MLLLDDIWEEDIGKKKVFSAELTGKSFIKSIKFFLDFIFCYTNFSSRKEHTTFSLK